MLKIQNTLFLVLYCLLVILSVSCKEQSVSPAPASNISFHQGGGNYTINSVIKTKDGGFLANGLVRTGLNLQVFLLKYDSKGKEQWYKAHSNVGILSISSVAETSDGGYLIVGTGNVISWGINYYFSSSILKTNSEGDRIWLKNIDPNYIVYAACSDHNGFIYAVGSGVNTPDNVIYKYKNNGDTVLHKKFANPDSSSGLNVFKMIANNNNGLTLFAGLSYYPPAQLKYNLLVVDSLGSYTKKNIIYNSSRYQNIIVEKMEQETDGSYHLDINFVDNLNVPFPFYSNCFRQLIIDQNLNPTQVKLADSVCPKTAFIDPNVGYSPDDNVTYTTDQNNNILEGIPLVSYSIGNEYQGKFVLTIKDQNRNIISNNSYPGWPAGVFRLADNRVFICGSALSPSSQTRGIFNMLLDQNGSLIK